MNARGGDQRIACTWRTHPADTFPSFLFSASRLSSLSLCSPALLPRRFLRHVRRRVSPGIQKVQHRGGEQQIAHGYLQNSISTYSLSLMTLSKLSLLITKIPSSSSTLARVTVTRHSAAKPNPPTNLMTICVSLSLSLTFIRDPRALSSSRFSSSYGVCASLKRTTATMTATKKTGRRGRGHRPRGTREE